MARLYDRSTSSKTIMPMSLLRLASNNLEGIHQHAYHYSSYATMTGKLQLLTIQVFYFAKRPHYCEKKLEFNANCTGWFECSAFSRFFCVHPTWNCIKYIKCLETVPTILSQMVAPHGDLNTMAQRHKFKKWFFRKK